MSEPGARRLLAAYSTLFAAAGAAFLLAPGTVCAVLGALTFARPPGGPEATLWLGLTGSLMAVLTLLAADAARDPSQGAAWRALLLSKGVSSALFLVYALTGGGRAFLGAAAVDGAILLHLALLREAAEPLDAWSIRGAAREAFFLIVRDAASGAAFWLRHEADRRGGRCQWAVTDRDRVRQGERASAPFEGLGRNASRGPHWSLTWEDGPVPPYALVPRWLWRLGAAGTLYVTAAPAARFTGTVELDGRRWELSDAPGCVGHLWSRRGGARWRWAHAYWPERDVMVEALTARGRLTPALTATAVWRDGRLSLARAWGLGAWSLSMDLARTCTLAQDGVLVRHCTSGMAEVEGLSGPAAVESAEEA